MAAELAAKKVALMVWNLAYFQVVEMDERMAERMASWKVGQWVDWKAV